jgi:hypothetical protein
MVDVADDHALDDGLDVTVGTDTYRQFEPSQRIADNSSSPRAVPRLL